MSNTEALFKSIMTIVIWVILGAISVMSIISGMDDVTGWVALLVLAPIFIAFLSTGAIWSPSMFADSDDNKQLVEKAKREAGQSKLDLLMEMMDEDEREAFKETLKRQVLRDVRVSQDGELPIDAELWETDYQGGKRQ